MKGLIFTAVILISYLNVRAQDPAFTIRETGSSYSNEQITDAMKNADWCGFYYENSQRVLRFDDGAVVELKSAQQLAEVSGVDNPLCTSRDEYLDNNTYSVHSTGRILIKVANSGVTKLK